MRGWGIALEGKVAVRDKRVILQGRKMCRYQAFYNFHKKKTQSIFCSQDLPVKYHRQLLNKIPYAKKIKSHMQISNCYRGGNFFLCGFSCQRPHVRLHELRAWEHILNLSNIFPLQFQQTPIGQILIILLLTPATESFHGALLCKLSLANSLLQGWSVSVRLRQSYFTCCCFQETTSAKLTGYQRIPFS